jgi:signal transduction histidine kinase
LITVLRFGRTTVFRRGPIRPQADRGSAQQRRRRTLSGATFHRMLRALDPRLRQALIDWLAPLTILVIGIVNVSRLPDSQQYPGPPLAHLAFLATAVAALGLRRHAPLIAPALAMVIATVWSVVLWTADSQGPFEGFLVLVGASYSIGAHNRGRRLVLGAGFVAAYFVGGQVIALAGGGRDGDLLPLAFWMVVGLAVGALINRRTHQAHEARQHAAVLTVDHERRMSEAVENERARIARELHDVVAHSLSVIVVQAAAERRAMSHGPADLVSIDAVLGSVERTGREALVDLRRLLGLLRQTDEPLTLQPQPKLADLDALVREIRAAGVEVDVRIEGGAVPLPPGVDLTAYRIVQEALTNVLKHAGATRVEVVLGYRNGQLDVAVTDNGTSEPATELVGAGAGHGLLGMRERVSVFGGTVSAGSRPDGGWAVRARLPVAEIA